MSWQNQFPTLKLLFDGLTARVSNLETGRRFTFPNVSSDPTNPVKGDAWLNITTNQAKIVDANGTVKVVTWS